LPSWLIHLKVAELFNIPLKEAESVNKIVDYFYVHDLGKNLPSIGTYLLELENKYLSEKQKKEKSLAKELEQAFSKMPSGTFSDAFFLHHAVDMLGLRISSALLIKEDLDRRMPEMVRGIILDLNGIQYDVRRFCERRHFKSYPKLSERLNEKIEKELPSIGRFPELLAWVEDKVIRERRRFDDINYVKELIENRLERIIRGGHGFAESQKKIYKATGLKEEAENLAEAYRRRYVFGSIMGYVAKLACYSSRIIDYFFVTDLSSELIKDTLFRKGSSVGGWHVDALINYPDKAFDYVERDLRELEKSFLQKRGLELPEESIKTYYKILKMGYDLVCDKIKND